MYYSSISTSHKVSNSLFVKCSAAELRFEAWDEFSTNFYFIFLFKYSWHFRTFGKAEYFGWNGMPIIGKTNHATELVAFEWRLSRKIFKTFKLLAKNQKKSQKKPGKEVVPRLDFWAASVFDPFCLWRKIFSWLQVEIGDIDINGKLLETISSTENLGLFRKISVRMMKTSRTKYTEEDNCNADDFNIYCADNQFHFWVYLKIHILMLLIQGHF